MGSNVGAFLNQSVAVVAGVGEEEVEEQEEVVSHHFCASLSWASLFGLWICINLKPLV